MNSTFRMRVVRQLTRVLLQLHEASVVHNAMQWDNIIVSNDGQHFFLSNFSYAVDLKSADSKASALSRRPPAYLAPEVLRSSFDTKADMWSLAIVHYQMLLERSQLYRVDDDDNGGARRLSAVDFFSTLDRQRYARLILNDSGNQNRPPPPLEASPDEWRLISRCWSHRANQRPSPTQYIDEIDSFVRRLERDGERALFPTPDPNAGPPWWWKFLPKGPHVGEGY
jgi:serine/threonine protein kinase